MIAYIKGKIISKSESTVVVENHGIGYKVFVPAGLWEKMIEGQVVEFFIYHQVKEDGQNLFGFAARAELELFEKLVSVSGIGPKTALNVLAAATAQDIKSAIINQDASILRKVSGIGAKTAERIILELKNKIAGLIGVGGIKSSEELEADSDTVEALMSLGFSGNEVREALKRIDKGIEDSGEKVKAALRLLKK